MKLVRRKLADGTIKTYEYPAFRTTRLATLNKRAKVDRRTSLGKLVGLRDLGIVYFIKAGTSGPIKIGFSRDLDNRLFHLQTGHYEDLRVELAVAANLHLERRLHLLFKRHHIRGEWYADNEELRREMEALKKEFSAPTGHREHDEKTALENVLKMARKGLKNKAA